MGETLCHTLSKLASLIKKWFSKIEDNSRICIFLKTGVVNQQLGRNVLVALTTHLLNVRLITLACITSTNSARGFQSLSSTENIHNEHQELWVK